MNLKQTEKREAGAVFASNFVNGLGPTKLEKSKWVISGGGLALQLHRSDMRAIGLEIIRVVAGMAKPPPIGCGGV